MGEEASNFTAEMAANNPGGRRVQDNGFRVKRTARGIDASGLISPSSGSNNQHTMVLTSKVGARHQRMELSVRTAVKFYLVQDMLGFDQPSQAVEWLIEKAEAAIRELPQPTSICASHRSQYVDSNRGAVSSSCTVQTGDLNSSSQGIKTSTDNEDRRGNLHDEIAAAARTCIGQSTESNTKNSIGQGVKRGQRSVATRSVDSNRGTKEPANAVPPKEFRAKAREKCRQRTKPKDKSYSQQGGIHGIWQKSYVCPHYPTFCLQENKTPTSSMMNETTDTNSSSNAFLHDLMLPSCDSTKCNHSRRCITSAPAKIQCSSDATVHYSDPKQEGSSSQSTVAFSKSVSSNT